MHLVLHCPCLEGGVQDCCQVLELHTEIYWCRVFIGMLWLLTSRYVSRHTYRLSLFQPSVQGMHLYGKRRIGMGSRPVSAFEVLHAHYYGLYQSGACRYKLLAQSSSTATFIGILYLLVVHRPPAGSADLLHHAMPSLEMITFRRVKSQEEEKWMDPWTSL